MCVVFFFDTLFTVELLNPSDVITGEPEVLCVGVDGSHECSRVLGVLQAQSMAKLMSCHQEQTVAWKIVTKDCINTPEPDPYNPYIICIITIQRIINLHSLATVPNC